MNVIETNNAPAAIGPYSQAYAANGFLFTSGQIPLRADGEMVLGDAPTQVVQVFANLDAVLKAAGCGRDQVVRTTVYLIDLEEFAAVNEIYAEFFGQHRPARACVQVAALPKGARVEIDLIAELPQA
jgi:2-iminobutanoate/2-iminopropanoate deaminase